MEVLAAGMGALLSDYKEDQKYPGLLSKECTLYIGGRGFVDDYRTAHF
ncbi:hypothetical protein [Bacteroidetes bacterium endosymbiont of Geopemphigus sp.]|nr:hypothetical protein [Bacteroidetes bacterium endosymbiont of Geopemphigus sp.]